VTSSSPPSLGAPMAGAPAAPVPSAATARRRAGWKWQWAAYFLSAAAQLITISALLSAYPPSATWAPLLLAVLPVPLGAVIAFADVPAARIAAVVSLVAIVAGFAGSWRLGLFFIPALIALLGAIYTLWRQPA
jgi:hypothetical protein